MKRNLSPNALPPAIRRFKALHKGSSNKQFRKDRGQDDKDMAFETLGLKPRIFSLDEREAGTTIFLQRSYKTRMALESSRLAELKHAISAAWDVRKKLTASDNAI